MCREWWQTTRDSGVRDSPPIDGQQIHAETLRTQIVKAGMELPPMGIQTAGNRRTCRTPHGKWHWMQGASVMQGIKNRVPAELLVSFETASG